MLACERNRPNEKKAVDMNKATYRGHGSWAGAGAVIVLLCVSLFGPAGAPSMPQTRHLHVAAYRTDRHGDHGDGNDDGPRHSTANPAHPDTASGGLAHTLNDVALLAPPPIRPGTAKRTGSTPIVSHAVRPGITKPAPHLLGMRSGVPGVTTNQNGPLAIGVAGTAVINQNGPLTIGPGEAWTASASCPTGLATSGGESNTSSAGVVLNQSYAYGDGSGWIVEVRNQSTQSATYTVYAVCTAGLTNYRTVNSDITLDPGQFGEASVLCPEGTTVRGTGIQAGVNAGIQWYDTHFKKEPLGGSDVQVNNLDTRIGQFSAQAICANGTPLGYSIGNINVDLPPNGYVKSSVEVLNAGDEVIEGGGGSFNFQQSAITYLTDSYPDIAADGRAAWSVYVRNTENKDTSAQANLRDVGP